VRGKLRRLPAAFKIVEKKKDGKPYELHTDLTDSLTLYSKIRMAYFWYAEVMFALALMFSVYTVWMKSVYMALGAVLCGSLGFLWLIPGVKTSQKVRRLKEEAETHEYEAPSMKKKVLIMIAAVAIPIFLASLVFGALYVSGVQFDSYWARGMVQSSWGTLERKLYRVERLQAAACILKRRYTYIYYRNHNGIGRIKPFYHRTGRNGILQRLEASNINF
jgi:hypothetical protein